jgi:hypothetical protein
MVGSFWESQAVFPIIFHIFLSACNECLQNVNYYVTHMFIAWMSHQGND